MFKYFINFYPVYIVFALAFIYFRADVIFHDECNEYKNIKNYTNQNITNIDNAELNTKIYNAYNSNHAYNGNYSYFELTNQLYHSAYKSLWLPDNYGNIYKNYDTKFDNFKEDFNCIFRSIYYNNTVPDYYTKKYYECKTSLRNKSSEIYIMRNALNKINNNLHNRFVKEYYIDNCHSNLVKYKSFIRDSRYKDIIEKFDMDTQNLNLIHVLLEYV